MFDSPAPPPAPLPTDAQYAADTLLSALAGVASADNQHAYKRAPLGDVRSIPLDDIAVHQICGIEQTLLRSARSARERPIDLLKMCLMVQGHATIEQDGVVVDIGPGEFALYDTRRPYRLTNHDAWRFRVMTVDRHDLTISAST